MTAKKIYLKSGEIVLVDKEFYEQFAEFPWINVNGYCGVNMVNDLGGWNMRYMHRILMGEPEKGYVIDHINGDKLDNQLENLRVCTIEENLRNRGKQKNNKSGYKGVCWHSRAERWLSSIGHKGKQVFIGYFDDKVEAAMAYDKVAEQLHGEFAYLNFGGKKI